MEILTNSLFWALVSTSLFQAIAVLTYLNVLRPYWDAASQAAPPYLNLKAAIVLCLRGADPFLSDCIGALLQQKYPNYEVHIVVDSQTDPAWEIVQQTLKDAQQSLASPVPVKVMALTNPRSTCSLKCSALLQAINGLADDIEIVALVDADTVAHPLWLQELVKPFSDPEVGVATGNRWYVPNGNRLGTYARYLWNAFSIVSMYLDKTPWGGTVAVRASHLRQPHVQERWATSLCEDVPLHVSVLKEEKLKFKFVPSLLIVNREECDLSDFVRWSMRQQILVRLYHPYWFKIAGISLSSPLLSLLSMVTLLYAIATHHWDAATHLGTGIAFFYSVGIILPLILLHYGVQRVLQVWGQPLPAISPSAIVRLFVAMNVTFMTSLYTIAQASRAKDMQWRGISYRIESSQKVHLVEYFPFQPSQRPISTKISV